MSPSPTPSTSPGTPGTPAHQRDAGDVVAALATDSVAGLSSSEAAARLSRHGPNRLTTTPPTPAWRRLAAQFSDILARLLIVAAIVSSVAWLIEREERVPYDAIVILAILLVNAVLGFVQEDRAQRAVAALTAMTAPHATVVRDGIVQQVDATTLVPGDVLVLAEGDAISADARLVEHAELRTVEGALTGESTPSAKHTARIDADVALGDRANTVFAGTAVASGRGRAVVVATGMGTEVGSIAALLERTESTRTPLQAELDRTGRRLAAMVVAIAVVIAVVVLVTQHEVVDDLGELTDVLLLAVALAVAAVPEGLPAVVTTTLALGVQRIARRNAIVRKLPAVETLGSASVIASDKTGTLTRNEMTTRVVVTSSGRVDLDGVGWTPNGSVAVRESWDAGDDAVLAELRETLAAAALCNDAHLVADDGGRAVVGDPTEAALLVAAEKAGLDLAALHDDQPRLAEVPFTSERKRMSTLHRRDGQLRLYVKGAADIVIARCTGQLVAERDGTVRRVPMDDTTRQRIAEAIEVLNGQALRTLAVAVRGLPDGSGPDVTVQAADESELVLLGVVGMIDPPRPAARPSVAAARRAGIRPLMITGDHPATAAAIAREIGIVDDDARVMTGRELEAITDDDLDQVVEEVAVYARVDPAHKLRIVQALQRRGHVVAMTGDGVNDAPALLRADIGVAMGLGGTDVSKEAADMILLDDDFATIVAAVEEGRGIFANIRKFLRYLLTSSIGEVVTMFLGVVFAGALGLGATAVGGGVVLPLLATQILWINLVTDGLPALALGLDPVDPEVMDRPPRPTGEGVTTPAMWLDMFALGGWMAVMTIAVLDASLPGGLLDLGGGIDRARTLAFTTLVLFQLVHALICHAGDHGFFHGLTTNRPLVGALGVSFAMQLAVVHVAGLQRAFSTIPLTRWEWLATIGVAATLVPANGALRLLRRGRGTAS